MLCPDVLAFSFNHGFGCAPAENIDEGEVVQFRFDENTSALFPETDTKYDEKSRRRGFRVVDKGGRTNADTGYYVDFSKRFDRPDGSIRQGYAAEFSSMGPGNPRVRAGGAYGKISLIIEHPRSGSGRGSVCNALQPLSSSTSVLKPSTTWAWKRC